MKKVTRLLAPLFVFTVAVLTTGGSKPVLSLPEPQKGKPSNIRCFCGGNPIVVVQIELGGDEMHTGCRPVLEKAPYGERKEICAALQARLEAQGKVTSCNQVGDLCPNLCKPDKATMCQDLDAADKAVDDFHIALSMGKGTPRESRLAEYEKLRKSLEPLVDKIRADFCNHPDVQQKLDDYKKELEAGREKIKYPADPYTDSRWNIGGFWDLKRDHCPPQTPAAR